MAKIILYGHFIFYVAALSFMEKKTEVRDEYRKIKKTKGGGG